MACLRIVCFMFLILTSSLSEYQDTYKASFVSPGFPYIKLGPTIPEPLKELTLCYWVRPHNHTSNVSMTVLSYAHPKRADELLAGLVTGSGVFFHRQKRDKNVSPAHSTYSIQVGQWTHVCITWSSLTGTTRIFINGKHANAFSDIAFGEVVETGGVVVIGQDQNIYGGSFKKDSGLQGDLSELHLWDTMLCDEIEKIYKCEIPTDGNVISWSKSRKIFYSGVQTSAIRLPCGKCQ
uniref:Pentraxin family member n=1 Tax=Strigamia maritima TaxID=126957 RepID=T1IGW4_STRMM